MAFVWSRQKAPQNQQKLAYPDVPPALSRVNFDVGILLAAVRKLAPKNGQKAQPQMASAGDRIPEGRRAMNSGPCCLEVLDELAGKGAPERISRIAPCFSLLSGLSSRHSGTIRQDPRWGTGRTCRTGFAGQPSDGVCPGCVGDWLCSDM